MILRTLMLAFVFYGTIFGSKEDNKKLILEAKVAIESKNYQLAHEIYSKLSNKRLQLENKQSLFELQGDYARALVCAYKRFLISGFEKRLVIQPQIHSLKARLGIPFKQRYLPLILHKKFKAAVKIEQVMSQLMFYKDCLTNFFLQLMALIFWIIFLFCFFNGAGKKLTFLAFAFFFSHSQELYYRLVLDNPNKIAFVVEKDVKLMTKPDFEDAIVIASVGLGQRVDIVEVRGEFLRVNSVDGESGWIAKKAIERIR